MFKSETYEHCQTIVAVDETTDKKEMIGNFQYAIVVPLPAHMINALQSLIATYASYIMLKSTQVRSRKCHFQISSVLSWRDLCARGTSLAAEPPCEGAWDFRLPFSQPAWKALKLEGEIWARESAWVRALILFKDENAINTKRQASKDLKRLEKKVLSRDLSKSCPLYQYFARINIIVTWKF